MGFLPHHIVITEDGQGDFDYEDQDVVLANHKEISVQEILKPANVSQWRDYDWKELNRSMLDLILNIVNFIVTRVAP
jgi:hypothetical protein